MESTAAAEGGKGGGEDPSMEEILQSIRRIIAEEGDGKAPNGQAAATDAAVHGSDVLELTEMVKEDGSTEILKSDQPAPPADVLSKIDEALETEKKPEAPAAEAPKPEEPKAAEPKPEEPKAAEPAKPAEPPAPPPPAEKPKAEAAPEPPKAEAPKPQPPKPAAAKAPEETLVSSSSAGVATGAIEKLRTAMETPPPKTSRSPVFDSGASVEDLVMQALRPMIKEWLDANLPKIVEHIVEREVKRLTR